jgi:hypothetical protein
VETAAEKIKGAMDSPPLPPAPTDKHQKPRDRTADE